MPRARSNELREQAKCALSKLRNLGKSMESLYVCACTGLVPSMSMRLRAEDKEIIKAAIEHPEKLPVIKDILVNTRRGRVWGTVTFADDTRAIFNFNCRSANFWVVDSIMSLSRLAAAKAVNDACIKHLEDVIKYETDTSRDDEANAVDIGPDEPGTFVSWGEPQTVREVPRLYYTTDSTDSSPTST